MVQVAMGPDASGEKVRPSTLCPTVGFSFFYRYVVE